MERNCNGQEQNCQYTWAIDFSSLFQTYSPQKSYLNPPCISQIHIYSILRQQDSSDNNEFVVKTPPSSPPSHHLNIKHPSEMPSDRLVFPHVRVELLLQTPLQFPHLPLMLNPHHTNQSHHPGRTDSAWAIHSMHGPQLQTAGYLKQFHIAVAGSSNMSCPMVRSPSLFQ